jgi:hypothetical protein
MQEVRQSIMDEVANSLSPMRETQKFMRPLTADSNSLKREVSPQKKFKMLKELARLN